jgi:glycosyltransferase involved in cell wall biosynthesis
MVGRALIGRNSSAMSAKLRVLLSIPDLQDLGVQHDVRCLMKYWNRDRFEPAMLLHRRTGAFADQFSPDMASIEVDDFVLNVPKIRVLLRVLGYRRAFDEFRPDAVISFVPYCNLASAMAKRVARARFGLAVSEHAHVTASLADRDAFSAKPFLGFYRRSFPYIYNREADLVKCIAEESRQDLIEHHGITAAKTRLIHNPVDFDEVRRLARDAVDHPWFDPAERQRIPLFINVGRLAPQKQQDILLRAFAAVRSRGAARLAVVGRGDRETSLRSLAKELGIANDVVFMGFQRNPWKYMSRATATVLSSMWEGLPCVVTESMVLGVPVVSTRCPSGPTEMLLDGKAGYLCPVGDVEGLATAMQDVIGDPSGTTERVAVATENLHRFEPHNVTEQYERLAMELRDLAYA